MPANSLASAFSLGVQSAKDTAATTYHTALATISGADVLFDTQDPPLEHPAPATRSTLRKSAPERVGYLAPVNATFLLHPRFIGRVLRAMGFAVSTVNNTTHYTHTFTIAADASVAWMTAIHLWSGATDLQRKITNLRGESLALNADLNQIQCVFQGVGLVEGNATGSETKVAEINTLLKPNTGSITFEVDGGGITTTYRGNQLNIAQQLDRDERVLHSSGRAGLSRLSIDATGTLQGIDIDLGTYEHWKEIKRGGTSGTAPSLTPVTGELSWQFTSADNISGAAVPYSLTTTVAEAAYDMVSPNANGQDLIRGDITWEMIDSSTPPLSIVLVNDQASYA